MQKDIEKRQNEKRMLDMQYAARIFGNRAENSNYFVWIFCILGTAISIWGNNSNCVLKICLIFVEIGAFLSQVLLGQNTKRFSECRKAFDRYVLFDEKYEITESLFICIQKVVKRKDYQIQITHNGKDCPPGVKDWYSFSSGPINDDSCSIIDCQRQNNFWTRIMIKWRTVIVITIGLVVTIALLVEMKRGHLKVLFCVVGGISLLLKCFERIWMNMKYLKLIDYIEGAADNLLYHGNMAQIENVQNKIDELRSIPVFALNSIHKKTAKYYSQMYDELCKRRFSR